MRNLITDVPGVTVLAELGAAAADCLARAVARGVYEASALPYAASLPDYRQRFGRSGEAVKC